MSPHNPSPVCRRSGVSPSRRAILNLLTGVISVAVSDCAGPPVLEQQVLGYDEVTKTLDEKLLLLNIARVANIETVHFTATSSIAPTFNWTATLGAGGQIEKPHGPNLFNFSIGGSSSENPTFRNQTAGSSASLKTIRGAGTSTPNSVGSPPSCNGSTTIASCSSAHSSS